MISNQDFITGPWNKPEPGHEELSQGFKSRSHPCGAGLEGPSSWPSAGSVWPSEMGSHSWTCLLLKQTIHTSRYGRDIGSNPQFPHPPPLRDQVLLSLPLNSPLMPPIFFTIWANLVYWVSSSWTSLVATPDPRATLWILLGCLLNSLAPSLLSSSADTHRPVRPVVWT